MAHDPFEPPITPFTVCQQIVNEKHNDRIKRFGTEWRTSFGILRDKLSDSERLTLADYVLDRFEQEA